MGRTQYPKGRMLVIRDCMKEICLKNSAATKLLSSLMYWYDHSEVDCRDGIFSIKRTQSELIEDMCGETNATTLHCIAVPFLQLLGYLDIEGKDGTIRYDVHVDRVQQALDAFSQNALTDFLQHVIPQQFKKFGIEISDDEFKKIGINSKIFELQFKKIGIVNQKFLNCKRGRKPTPQVASEGKNEPIEIKERIRENIKEITTTYTEPIRTPQKGVDADASQQQISSLKKKVSSRKPKEKQHELVLPEPEPDLSNLTEQQRMVYEKLLSAKDRPMFLAWDQEEKEIYTNFLGSLGFKVPLPITPKVIEVTKQNKYMHYSIEDFINYRKRILQNDRFYPNGKPRPKEKQYYAVRGVKYWDILREAASWIGMEEQTQPAQTTKQEEKSFFYDDMSPLERAQWETYFKDHPEELEKFKQMEVPA